MNNLCRLFPALAALLILATPLTQAQSAPKPRDADEEHAWRLHNQYKASKRKETDLTTRIKALAKDIASVMAPSPGLLFANNQEDIAELARMRAELKTEQDRQKALVIAWDKKFYGRYDHLQNSMNPINDAKTKREMDEIEFQLTYFAFKFNARVPFDPIKATETLTARIEDAQAGGPTAKGTSAGGTTLSVIDPSAPSPTQDETSSGAVSEVPTVNPPDHTEPPSQATDTSALTHPKASTPKQSNKPKHKKAVTPDKPEDTPETPPPEESDDGKEDLQGETDSSIQVAGAEGAFDGVYRGQVAGDRMAVMISGAIATVDIGKISMSGAVDKNGNIRANWSGVTSTAEVSDGKSKGTIKITSSLSLKGRAKGDSVSGTLHISNNGPGGFNEELPTVNWTCKR
jgi:hypothetical protein